MKTKEGLTAAYYEAVRVVLETTLRVCVPLDGKEDSFADRNEAMSALPHANRAVTAARGAYLDWQRTHGPVRRVRGDGRPQS